MVAPTRKPQARGVKCDLCKKILNDATWLDQTKLARKIKDASSVLELIKQHDCTNCPCIPKSIQNLLVGSTHFEIHRLLFRDLDNLVCEKQQRLIQSKAQRPKQKHETIINDCSDLYYTMSRFKIYIDPDDSEVREKARQQLKHLSKAIDFWKVALEDVANPFNSKLALRLGLTHHVIYACYLYKYYKVTDYQLISANLLLNLFKSIEGVTTNALMHAYYILIKSLIDCNQFQVARHYLKQATKINNYQDKTYYESILVACVECELNLLDNHTNSYDALDVLAKLAIINENDKLQHYYARTLALAIVIRYINYYPAKSDLCFEFYHTFRYICAIIRRCYENVFELVLFEKNLLDSIQLGSQQSAKQSAKTSGQILDYSWIRFAVCDFVFTTFDLISNFFIRSGQPEQLELLYNSLNLITYRNGSCYWQFKMLSIGISLDSLCDKYDEANKKFNALSHIIGHENNSHLMNVLRLELEIIKSTLPESSMQKQGNEVGVMKQAVIMDTLQRIKCCHNSWSDKISQIELYDCKSNNFLTTKLSNTTIGDSTFIVLNNILGHLSLKLLKTSVASLLKIGHLDAAQDLIKQLGNQLSANHHVLEYYDCQLLLELLIGFADIENSESVLLEAIGGSNIFLENESFNLMQDDETLLESKLSSLTLNSDATTQSLPTKKTPNCSSSSSRVKKFAKSKCKLSQLSCRPSKRKQKYDVASQSEENLYELQSIRFFDTIEAVKNFSSLNKEEMVVTYLRNCEPNADYLIYRRAHELMICFRLKDVNQNHDHLLYHFSESTSSNTMRYRWMMFEEQRVLPFEPTSKVVNNGVGCLSSGHLKYLSFSNTLINIDKTVRSFKKVSPDDTRLVQCKYIVDLKSKKEHLLIACSDHESEPFYIHVEKPVSSDDFIQDSKLVSNEINQETLALSATIASRFNARIEEAKKTLFFKNHRNRTEARQRIEGEIGVLLHDLEDEFLGPFIIFFLGKIVGDQDYQIFVQNMIQETQATMSTNFHTCNSSVALKVVIENGFLIGRDKFCHLIAVLFNCPSSSSEVRDCFEKLLKSFESFLKQQNQADLTRDYYLSSLTRGPLGLILNSRFELIPLESMPLIRFVKQGVFRVPSLRLYYTIASRFSQNLEIDADETCYMLDPANNLAKTREKFELKLKNQEKWNGTISQAPQTDLLERWLLEKQVYLFIGHGAGTTYYNKLCKQKGLTSMQSVKPVAIVMGCSSGRVLAEGPRLEAFGINWVFIFKGSPAYVGLLWDVTDIDIDKFLDSFMSNWMHSKWSIGDGNGVPGDQERRGEDGNLVASRITDAIARSRQVCQLKFLVGSTPIIYGLPVSCLV